jgi:tubulin monoglycylase TTLL15
MWNKNDNLRTMKRVFNRIGHEMVNGSERSDWDVLWSIEYPFKLFENEMKNLTKHQKVNHFPGINYITFKAFMVTNNNFDFIPKSFEFPHMIEKFQKFIAENPEKKFVRKAGSNRGVKNVEKSEIEFGKTENNDFYQEFIENPLLIENHAFDLGVYVVISSINPLRVYRHKTEVLLRFCPEVYHPFDSKNKEKYVVYETQKTIFDIPTLKDLCSKMGFSFKASFDNHLKSRGFDVNEFWARIDEIIVQLTLSNEKNFIKETEKFATADHFFELLRFDFVIDDNLKIYLMEANMSPNLTPADDRFEGHSESYEKVVYDTLNLILGDEIYLR